MNGHRLQRTIARAVSVKGVGYWTGKPVMVEFRPAQPNTGLVFVREDLAGRPAVAASIENHVDSPRRTCLAGAEAKVDMVEHVLAALAGLEIDNCEIAVTAQEMPGLDGSAWPFVEALDSADLVVQSAWRKALVVSHVVRVEQGDSWIEARPAPRLAREVEYSLDYGPQSPIPVQHAMVPLSPAAFRRELAACRTFLLEEEASALLAQGLGAKTSLNDLLVFGSKGLMGNTLRYVDECARHKILDMVGDLALVGMDILGRVVAHKSGHRLNAQLVMALCRDRAATLWRQSA